MPRKPIDRADFKGVRRKMIASFRRIAYFAAVLLMCGGIAAAAPFQLGEFNHHNGVIFFENHSGQRVQVMVFWHSHGMHAPVEVDPGHSFVFNNCCYAAGSVYRVVATVGHGDSFTGWTKPVLCSARKGWFAFSSVTFIAPLESDGKFRGEFHDATYSVARSSHEFSCH